MRDAGARAALVVQLLLQRRVQLQLQREKTGYSENKQHSLLAPASTQSSASDLIEINS